MDKHDFASMRAKIESKYQAEILRLEQERKALDTWYSEKLATLAVWAGEKSFDEWLENIGNLYVTAPLPVVTMEATLDLEKQRKIKPAINQAEEIRRAVYSLQDNIDNGRILEWIANNKPEISDSIQPRSIRSELWRLEKKGALKLIGKIGNSNVYTVIENAHETEQTNSLNGDHQN